MRGAIGGTGLAALDRMKSFPHSARAGLCRAALVLPIFVLAVACGDSRRTAFEPTEAEQPIGPDYPASHYEITVDGQRVGDARVWTPGAYPIRTNGKTRVIHVGLRLRNDSDAPIRLDTTGTGLEVITSRQRFIQVKKPLRITGQLRVEPGELQRIDLYYQVPRGMDVDDVQAFDLSWAVETLAGRYTQSTPFVQRQPERTYVVYRPHYAYNWWYRPWHDPWYYY